MDQRALKTRNNNARPTVTVPIMSHNSLKTEQKSPNDVTEPEKLRNGSEKSDQLGHGMIMLSPISNTK